jgi:hypothetical protein
MAPPVGLQIGNNPKKPTHRVGKLIGSGACSNVHELEAIDGSSVEEFAIKLTPIPPPKNPSSKRKPTLAERHANLLNYETLMYKAQLNKLHGKYAPYLPPPKGPPQSGDADGTFEALDFLENASISSSHVPFFLFLF